MAFSPLLRYLLYLVRLPAVIKGGKFESNAFIGPGYDWLTVRWRGITLKEGVLIGKNAWLQIVGDNKKSRIVIGKNTHIGRNSVISAKGEIIIGDGCLFSYGVSLLDHDHVFNSIASPTKTGVSESEPIRIGNNCFIGAHSFILKGVELGDQCIVGANSVVTHSFPDGSIIVGIPACRIK